MKKLLLSLFLVFATVLNCTAQAPCVASFSTTPITIGNNLLGVQITNLSTYGTLGSNQTISMAINYGTGYWGSVAPSMPYYWYTTPGTYSIKLAIRKYDSLTNATICTDTMTQTYTAAWPLCGAIISAVNGSSNGVVTFTATNPAGSPGIIYFWDFGDGSPAGTGSPIAHTYANGTYTCTMVSLLPSGCSDTNSIVVSASNTPINCSSLASTFASVTHNGITDLVASATNVLGYTTVYDWDFGNGTFSVGTSPYAFKTYAPGTYTVALRTLWKNSANVTVCSDTVTQTITVVACPGTPPSFTTSITSPGTVAFTNTSTVPAPFTAAYWWTFSPSGGWSSAINPTYTYTSVGTYNVTLIRRLIDSASNTYCTDTAYSTVVITSVPPPPPPPNIISGNIYFDSSANTTFNPFVVYLIQFNATTNMLTAVDSTTISGYWGSPYNFNNKPTGNYFVKASLQNNVVSTNGLIPTYHDSSLYWATATNIVHTGSSTANRHVYMKRGTTTAGPGFVGGNVSLGANKGAGAGVPDMPIYLRNSSNDLVKTVYTDANGDYTFENVPAGNYNVYPESMNYTTTPYTSIIVTATQPYLNLNTIKFNQDNAQMTIKPRSTTAIAGISSTASFNIFPNPAKNKVVIKWHNIADKKADVIVTNITGQLILTKEISLNNTEQSLDVSRMQTGIYFIKLHTASGDFIQKLSIQH